MITIQCDKNLGKIFLRLANSLNIQVKISDFSDNHTNIAIIRNSENTKTPSADYLIINSDDKTLANSISGKNCKIISCGFSNRSTVTISSITETECVLCLQRSLKSISGKTISPFELPIKLYGIKFDDVSIIMMITSALLCDVPVSALNKIHL